MLSIATQGYANADPDGINWQASWVVSNDGAYATFTVMAATDGWVGIGFSLNRLMVSLQLIPSGSFCVYAILSI